jgi:hypothetical protein
MTTRFSSRLHVLDWALGVLALALATGCGSTVNEDDEASAGSGAAGSGTGAGATGGDTGASTSSNGSGAAGGGDACAAFDDQPGTGTVTVRFRNDSQFPVYLPSNCSFVQYDIRPSSGDDGLTYAYDLSCTQTCEALQTESQYVCDACAPSSWLLSPGATLDVPWDGTAIQRVPMPASCWYEGMASGDCTQVLGAGADTYRVEAFGFGACESFTNAPTCECSPEGECFGTASGASATADVSEFDHPGTSLVEVVFGPCAFGCPPDPGGG